MLREILTLNASTRQLYPGFFFSSRRRHTRWPRDWSSDVCSSDLPGRRSRNVVRDREAGGAFRSGRLHSPVLREEQHLLVPWVVPPSQIPHAQARPCADPLERRNVVVVRVAVEVGQDLGRLPDRLEVPFALLVLVEGRVEPPAVRQHLLDVHQAANDAVDREVREHGLRPGEAERLAERLEVEALIGAERRSLVDEAVLRELDLRGGLEDCRILLHAEVVAGLEVADEVDAASERAATDVEEVMMRLQPLVD